MKFQFSKLDMFMHIVVLPYVCRLYMHMESAYIHAENFVRRIKSCIVVFLLTKIWFTQQYAACTRAGRLVRAELLDAKFANPVDITTIVKYYYYTDRIFSVASLHRWLQKFTPDLYYVSIFWTEGKELRAACLDLYADFEVLTQQDIVHGDMSLDTMPHKKIFISSLRHIREAGGL